MPPELQPVEARRAREGADHASRQHQVAQRLQPQQDRGLAQVGHVAADPVVRRVGLFQDLDRQRLVALGQLDDLAQVDLLFLEAVDQATRHLGHRRQSGARGEESVGGPHAVVSAVRTGTKRKARAGQYRIRQ